MSGLEKYDIRHYITPACLSEVLSLTTNGEIILSYKKSEEFLKSYSNLFPDDVSLKGLSMLCEKGECRVVYKKRRSQVNLWLENFISWNPERRHLFARKKRKDEMRIVSEKNKGVEITICEITSITDLSVVEKNML